jgi:hypothetical protein
MSEPNEDAQFDRRHLMPRQVDYEQKLVDNQGYNETIKILNTLEQQETSTFAPNNIREAEIVSSLQ